MASQRMLDKQPYQEFTDEGPQESQDSRVTDLEGQSLEIEEELPVQNTYTLKQLRNTSKKVYFDNKEYIYVGYRANFNNSMTFCACSATFFSLHNETMNVLSHFLPAIYFMVQLYGVLTKKWHYEKFESQQSVIVQTSAALSCLSCLFASSCYHQYGPLGRKIHYFLLKLDLIGIGVMIFGLTLTAVYIGFHNWDKERYYIMAVMTAIAVSNFLIQLTPCYTQDRYHWHRVVFYFLTLIICFGLAIAGRFYFGTALEVEQFYGQLELSFVYLGIGFVFYVTHFPECTYRKLRKRCGKGEWFKWLVQVVFPSHFWWHVFVALNGYTLYWLCYNFCVHVEYYDGHGIHEPGAPESN